MKLFFKKNIKNYLFKNISEKNIHKWKKSEEKNFLKKKNCEKNNKDKTILLPELRHN